MCSLSHAFLYLSCICFVFSAAMSHVIIIVMVCPELITVAVPGKY